MGKRHICFGKTLQLYLLVILLYLVNSLLFQLLETEELLYNTYESADFVEKILEQQRKYGWLTYIIMPVFISLRLLIVAVVLNVGVLVADVKVRFSKLWKTAIWAEFALIAYSFIHLFLIWLGDFSTLDEMAAYNPLSLSHYLNLEQIPDFVYYPIHLVNVSEIAYWVVLTIALMPVLGKRFFGTLGFVAKSYGIGLLLWISLVVFLSLNM